MPDESESGARRPGIFESARRLATTVVDAVHTRLDLAATEIEEERMRLERYVLLGVATLFFSSFGLILLTALIIACAWKSNVMLGLLALGVFTTAYLGLGAWSAITLQRLFKERPRFLEATREELKRDRDRLAAFRRK